MIFGDTAIITPYDDPAQYDAHWRSAFAAALVTYADTDDRLPTQYNKLRNDPWVRKQLKYIKRINNDAIIPDSLRPVQLASNWYQSNNEASIKFRLEPLLLTAASMETIAKDLGDDTIPVEAFQAYERLFFNVRKDDGTMHRSCFLRTHFSLPTGLITNNTPATTIWKVIAANSGYEALVSSWMWRDAHGLDGSDDDDYMLRETWRAAQAQMHHEIIGKRISHLNMTMLMDRITAHERMRHETSQTESADEALVKAALSMLAYTRPSMVSSSKTVDENVKLTQEIQSKLIADINRVPDKTVK